MADVRWSRGKRNSLLLLLFLAVAVFWVPFVWRF